MRILLPTVCVHTAMLGAHSLEDDFPSNNKKLAYASNIDLLFTIKYSATLLYLKKL